MKSVHHYANRVMGYVTQMKLEVETMKNPLRRGKKKMTTEQKDEGLGTDSSDELNVTFENLEQKRSFESWKASQKDTTKEKVKDNDVKQNENKSLTNVNKKDNDTSEVPMPKWAKDMNDKIEALSKSKARTLDNTADVLVAAKPLIKDLTAERAAASARLRGK